jgi:nucleoside-diphosphate-sugar epimerase
LARIRLVQQCVPVSFGCESSDGGLTAWIKEHRPHIWIHHHHFMENFRSPNYDLKRALSTGLGSLPKIVEAVAAGGGAGVIYSGTYFEQGERGQIWQNSEPTPYAVSKARIWDAICEECLSRGLGLSKIVIPNPVGPLENEDRLIPCLIRHSESGAALQLRSPCQLVDHVPIMDLAAHYVRSAAQLLTNRDKAVFRPSGRISTTLDWVQFAASELLERRLGLRPCNLEYDRHSVGARTGSEAVTDSKKSDSLDWAGFWDLYAGRLRSFCENKCMPTAIASKSPVVK